MAFMESSLPLIFGLIFRGGALIGSASHLKSPQPAAAVRLAERAAVVSSGLGPIGDDAVAAMRAAMAHSTWHAAEAAAFLAAMSASANSRVSDAQETGAFAGSLLGGLTGERGSLHVIDAQTGGVTELEQGEVACFGPRGDVSVGATALLEKQKVHSRRGVSADLESWVRSLVTEEQGNASTLTAFPVSVTLISKAGIETVDLIASDFAGGLQRRLR